MSKSIPHILNLICLAKTGHQLPSSIFMGENRWGYKKEGDKKIAIYRGVPDITESIIHDDPEFRIPRIALMSELMGVWGREDRNEKIRGLYVACLLYGVLELKNTPPLIVRDEYNSPIYEYLIKRYERKSTSQAGWNPSHDDNIEYIISKILSRHIEDENLEIAYYYKKFVKKYKKLGMTQEKIAYEWVCSLRQKGECRYFYDRVFSAIRNLEFALPSQSRLLLSSIPSERQMREEDIKSYKFQTYTEIAFHALWHTITSELYNFKDIGGSQNHLSILKALFRADIPVCDFVSPTAPKITKTQRKIYEKFWTNKPRVDTIERKIMRRKGTRPLSCIPEKFVSTSSGQIMKKKKSHKDFLQVVMVAIGSSLDYRDHHNVPASQYDFSTANPFRPLNDLPPNRRKWWDEIKMETGFLDKISSDDALRIFAPDKETEKKVIMDKVISNFHHR
mgnify:FL=1